MTKRGIKRCLTTRYVCLGICLIYNEQDCWPAVRISFYMACAPLNRMDGWWLCFIRAMCSPPFLRTSRAAPLDSREWRDKVIPLQCWKLREYVSPQLSFYTLFWDGSFKALNPRTSFLPPDSLAGPRLALAIPDFVISSQYFSFVSFMVYIRCQGTNILIWSGGLHLRNLSSFWEPLSIFGPCLFLNSRADSLWWWCPLVPLLIALTTLRSWFP